MKPRVSKALKRRREASEMFVFERANYDEDVELVARKVSDEDADRMLQLAEELGETELAESIRREV